MKIEHHAHLPPLPSPSPPLPPYPSTVQKAQNQRKANVKQTMAALVVLEGGNGKTAKAKAVAPRLSRYTLSTKTDTDTLCSLL